MKTQSILKTLAVTISVGAFALMSCTSQSTAETPAPEFSVEASATESLSVAPSPQISSSHQTMNPNQAKTEASPTSTLYIGMWVTKDGDIRH
jgi:uncharacterized cupin superfamily protein